LLPALEAAYFEEIDQIPEGEEDHELKLPVRCAELLVRACHDGLFDETRLVAIEDCTKLILHALPAVTRNVLRPASVRQQVHVIGAVIPTHIKPDGSLLIEMAFDAEQSEPLVVPNKRLTREQKEASRREYPLDLGLVIDALDILPHDTQKAVVCLSKAGQVGDATRATIDAIGALKAVRAGLCVPPREGLAHTLRQCSRPIGAFGSMVFRFEEMHSVEAAAALAVAMARPNSAAARLVLALLDDQLRGKIVADAYQVAEAKERAQVGGPLATHVLLSQVVPEGYVPRPLRRALITPPRVDDPVFTTVVHLGRPTLGSTVGKLLAMAVADAIVYLRDHLLDGCSSSMIVWFVDHKTRCDFVDVFHRENKNWREDAEQWATALLRRWRPQLDSCGLKVQSGGRSVVAKSYTDKFVVFISWDGALHRHGRDVLLDVLETRASIYLQPKAVADNTFKNLDLDEVIIGGAGPAAADGNP